MPRGGRARAVRGRSDCYCPSNWTREVTRRGRGVRADRRDPIEHAALVSLNLPAFSGVPAVLSSQSRCQTLARTRVDNLDCHTKLKSRQAPRLPYTLTQHIPPLRVSIPEKSSDFSLLCVLCAHAGDGGSYSCSIASTTDTSISPPSPPMSPPPPCPPPPRPPPPIPPPLRSPPPSVHTVSLDVGSCARLLRVARVAR